MEAVIIEEKPETGVVVMNGREFWIDATGGYVPADVVKPQHKLEDQAVRKIMAYALDLHAQIARFRGHTQTDLGALDALLAEKYGVKIGGKKGNRTYQTYDGLMKVKVSVQDRMDFGAELQVGKALLDECLNEWSAEGRPEIQAIVTSAFDTDKEGKINRTAIFKLLRHDIPDERWQRAMDAIRDAMRITGSKEYISFHYRASITDEFTRVTIDLAKT